MFWIEGCLALEHGASDGEQAVGDTPQGAAMAMTSLAQFRIAGVAPPPDLAGGWGDDQLVADALAYRSRYPVADIAVLTDDAEVITTAHTHGIGLLRPPRSWEMPPETTPDAKKLAKVTRELEEYRRSEPAIECEILDGSGTTVPALLLSASWRPPLEGQDADALALETIAAHPKVETFNRLGDGGIADESGWIVASESEIAAYAERYEEWRHELINHVARVGALSDDRNERFSLELALRNVGTRPAGQVRLILELTGGFTPGPARQGGRRRVRRYPDRP